MDKHEYMIEGMMQVFFEGMEDCGAPKEYHRPMLLAFAKGMEAVCRSMHASTNILDLEMMADAALKAASYLGSKKGKKK